MSSIDTRKVTHPEPSVRTDRDYTDGIKKLKLCGICDDMIGEITSNIPHTQEYNLIHGVTPLHPYWSELRFSIIHRGECHSCGYCDQTRIQIPKDSALYGPYMKTICFDCIHQSIADGLVDIKGKITGSFQHYHVGDRLEDTSEYIGTFKEHPFDNPWKYGKEWDTESDTEPEPDWWGESDFYL